MSTSKKSGYQPMADLISRRVGDGPAPVVEGWQQMLVRLLSRINPQLQDGSLVTFHTITSQEKTFFERLHRSVAVPAEARAVYISPSVRYQMMYGQPHDGRRPIPDHDPHNTPDRGVLLAYRRNDFETIVNALFATPPYAAAVDVYDNGRLLAGYVYESIDACILQLTEVLRVHL